MSHTSTCATLNPLPPDLGDILARFKKVLVPEMNLGQLRTILRARPTWSMPIGLNKIQGLPFKVSEIAGTASAGCWRARM